MNTSIKDVKERKDIGPFIAGFALGVLVMLVVGGIDFSPTSFTFGGDKASSMDNEGEVDNITMSLEGNKLVINNQLAGEKVLIEEITLTEPSWVVVHETSEVGLGNALGARRFDSGTYSGEINLQRNTETGNTYSVILYADDGDKKFNIYVDEPFRTNDGSFIGTNFETIFVDRKN